MKHTIVCAAVLASLLAVPLAATEGNSADKPAMAQNGQRHAAGWMKEKLGLSDEQAKKLEAAWQEHRKAVEPLREQMHKAIRKVHGVLEIEASDKDIQAALDQVEKVRGALHAEKDKLKKTMEALLTPAQRAKMLVMREKMMRHHGMAMDKRGYEGCERCEHGKGGHEGRQEWGRGGDRGEHRGFEGRKDWGHDQEQDDE